MADNYSFTPGVGATGASDEVGGVHYPRVKVAWGVDGSAADTSAANPLPVTDPGVYHYAAGTSTGTVTLNAGQFLRRVSVVAGASVAGTITIGGGNTITVPAGTSFDEQIVGLADGADVVIGGTIQAYYVAWWAAS